MSQERVIRTANGWAVLAGLFAYGVGNGFLIAYSFDWSGIHSPWQFGVGVFLVLLWVFLTLGFFTLEPNVSAVVLLFGAYRGTCRDRGLRWANPLYSKHKLSLRAHNFNGEKLKVNDSRGNPIEIAAVIVWRVAETAQAVFDVEDYKAYIEVQSESAVRHLASRYPYDTSDEHEKGLSLRGSIDEVSRCLQEELAERLGKAGVVVEEARLSHLAYAPEIAGAMLRRQQAEAIVAARSRLVDGAVGMVEMALAKLDEHQTVKLDDERRASMVSNLLVVLCGEREATPVVNAGTLYG
jgi:regulator of protease activity HflC (stomatin/prohibitin superfamily)